MIYFLIGTLAIAIIASVLNQIKPLQNKLGKFDKLHLLPNYSFFAPIPLTSDYRLAYKIISDSADTEWIELEMYKKFNLLRLVWNPFKYYNKGMIDLSHFLVTEFNALAEADKKYINISLNYLSILMVISKYLKARGEKDITIRFAILCSEGVDTVKVKDVMFASGHQKL